MSNSIQSKSAIVTGATKGIGLAVARAFLDRGARVMICARDEAAVNATVATLTKEHAGNIEGMACDVRDYSQVQALFKRTQSQFGGLDILINNAGVGLFREVEQMTPDEWASTIETNLTGVFYCCKEAVPAMRQRGGGFIINIGSLAGKNAFSGAAAYCASKFGLIGFSESLMQEVRYDHIRVSYLMPGSVDTEFGGNKLSATSS